MDCQNAACSKDIIKAPQTWAAGSQAGRQAVRHGGRLGLICLGLNLAWTRPTGLDWAGLGWIGLDWALLDSARFAESSLVDWFTKRLNANIARCAKQLSVLSKVSHQS